MVWSKAGKQLLYHSISCTEPLDVPGAADLDFSMARRYNVIRNEEMVLQYFITQAITERKIPIAIDRATTADLSSTKKLLANRLDK